MTQDNAHLHSAASEPMDAAEAVVHMIPVVLPAVGAALIFLLAFIAVHMA